MPSVSLICPTYGRFPDEGHLLAEVVESFRQQDWDGPAELVILNDCPVQELFCRVPGVHVINLSERLPSLGAKYNMLVELAAGAILLPAEDDDVFLPWRVSQAVERLMRPGPLGLDYFNPQRSWYLAVDRLHRDHKHGVCHNASAFTRRGWLTVGGYPDISGAQDAEMDGRLRSRAGGIAEPLTADPREWSYIYRWGVSSMHLSGNAETEKRWREHGEKLMPIGRFEVESYWQHDYPTMCRAACC